jgi:hypothetical protein
LIIQNLFSSMFKVTRPKPFLSQGVLVLAKTGEREKDVNVDSDSAENYPGLAVSTPSSSRMDEEHENRNHPAEASSSSTASEPICPVPANHRAKVSLSLSSENSEFATHSLEKDETFHPVPLILRDVTQIPDVNDSYTYSAVENSFHPDPNSFLALIDARLQVDGSDQQSVVALQEHDYTESLFPATNERGLTESLFPAADERDLTESLFPASEERHLTESLFTGLEEHTYTMSFFADESATNE